MVVGSSPSEIVSYQKAHGIIMGLVVVLLFPIGAIGMRIGGNMMVHRIIQMISLIALIVGFGLGIKLAQMTNYVSSLPHDVTLFFIENAIKQKLTSLSAVIQRCWHNSYSFRHCNCRSFPSAASLRRSSSRQLCEVSNPDRDIPCSHLVR